MINQPTLPTPSTSNWGLIGHEWAVDYLRRGLHNRRTRHAYLITGMGSLGKSTLALMFAMALNCTAEDVAQRPCGECRACRLAISGSQPDMIYGQLDENTGALKIEEIRSVMSKLALKPYESRYRIAVFADFDHAQPRAQDALLKTLEEPPPTAILLLLAASTEGIMPTITSRCQMIRLRPVPAEVIRRALVERCQLEEQQAGLLSGLSAGRPGWALQAAQIEEIRQQRDQALTLLEDLLRKNFAGRFEQAEELSKDRLAVIPLLELWLSYWRDVLLLVLKSEVKPCNSDHLAQMQQLVYDLTPEDALKALRATQTLLTQLTRAINVNLRLALEVLFLTYPQRA